MKFIADLHIHSHFSIATSKKLTPEYLEYWARIKGINVVGTGDCVHPGWLNELKEKLTPVGNGLFRLKKAYRLKEAETLSLNNIPEEVFFLLTGEISNIFKKEGKVRKVHNLCLFPDFEAVEKLQAKLIKIGNIASDGRPIIGMDSKYLLEMVLESSDHSFLVPAHIWTPWFSVLGSKSGFDNLEECYEDLTPHIFAVETGLSSDPPMNRLCGFLDNLTLISNSDAHSPEKLGREANLFDTEVTYSGIYHALKSGNGFLGTIEFFPQEGKYHYDGHRKCNIRWDPLETKKHKEICPVCQKPVTVGVMHRVAELADRSEPIHKKEFQSITSMPDLLKEVMGYKNSAGKAVQMEYFKLIRRLGSEFHILLDADLDEIKKAGGELLSRGIKKLRDCDVIIEEGYDGEFGRIKMFSQEEIDSFSGGQLFAVSPTDKNRSQTGSKRSVGFGVNSFKSRNKKSEKKDNPNPPPPLAETDEQKRGIEHGEGPCLVLAGPGSGKTRVLTERIFHLVTQKNVAPNHILAITFSNKAALEIRERLRKKMATVTFSISTFHAFGLSILKENYEFFDRKESFTLLDSDDKREMVETLFQKKEGINKIIGRIDEFKLGLNTNEEMLSAITRYESALKERNAFDFADLISLPVQLFKDKPEILAEHRKQIAWILIDEYQDINSRQYELIQLLAGEGKPNLFAIGDPDQAIYGFRGSDVRYIDRLKEDYPGLKTISLKKSYRCPGPVLKIGSQILKKDDYLAGKAEETKVRIERCKSEKSEADWIASQIEKMIGGVRSFSMDSGISDGEAETETGGFSDFSVLCRTTAMFDPLIKAFENHGIAYQVTGSKPFYRQEPFASIIKLFRQIYQSIPLDINGEETSLSGEIQSLIKEKKPLSDIFSRFMIEREISTLDQRRMERLTLDYGNEYDAFLISLAMRQGIDDYDERVEAVSLMTIHASKGLEFNTVFIPGCEDGIIPFELFGKKEIEELKEETRLFYVGVTRTKKYLFLTHADKRYIRGRMLTQKRSPFLDRLDNNLIHSETRKSGKSIPAEPLQLSLFQE